MVLECLAATTSRLVRALNGVGNAITSATTTLVCTSAVVELLDWVDVVAAAFPIRNSKHSRPA